MGLSDRHPADAGVIAPYGLVQIVDVDVVFERTPLSDQEAAAVKLRLAVERIADDDVDLL